MVGPIPPIPPPGAHVAQAAVAIDPSLAGEPPALPVDLARASIWTTGPDGVYRIAARHRARHRACDRRLHEARSRSRSSLRLIPGVDLVLNPGTIAGRSPIGSARRRRPDHRDATARAAAAAAAAATRHRRRLAPLTVFTDDAGLKLGPITGAAHATPSATARPACSSSHRPAAPRRPAPRTSSWSPTRCSARSVAPGRRRRRRQRRPPRDRRGRRTFDLSRRGLAAAQSIAYPPERRRGRGIGQRTHARCGAARRRRRGRPVAASAALPASSRPGWQRARRGHHRPVHLKPVCPSRPPRSPQAAGLPRRPVADVRSRTRAGPVASASSSPRRCSAAPCATRAPAWPPLTPSRRCAAALRGRQRRPGRVPTQIGDIVVTASKSGAAAPLWHRAPRRRFLPSLEVRERADLALRSASHERSPRTEIRGRRNRCPRRDLAASPAHSAGRCEQRHAVQIRPVEAIRR
jgi:hypothetical protein